MVFGLSLTRKVATGQCRVPTGQRLKSLVFFPVQRLNA